MSWPLEVGKAALCYYARARLRLMLIAGWSRYDALVELLAAPTSRSSRPHVVSASLAVAKLAQSVSQAQEHWVKQVANHGGDSYGPYARRRCDVYVASFGPGLLDTRLDIVVQLWRHGISADLLYDGDWQSSEEAMASWRRESFLFVIIVKPNVAANDQRLRVRNVLRGSEEDGTRLPTYRIRCDVDILCSLSTRTHVLLVGRAPGACC